MGSGQSLQRMEFLVLMTIQYVLKVSTLHCWELDALIILLEEASGSLYT